MVVATLTELNRNPSRLAQIAEREPVHILRYGREYLVLHRVADPVEDMRAAGLIRQPKAVDRKRLPSLDIDPEFAEDIYQDFLLSRSLDD